MKYMKDINNGLTQSDLYNRMLRWQFLAVAAVAIIAYFVSGLHASFSVLAGGFSVMFGAFIASKVAARTEGKTDPSVILVNLLKAEATKIIIVAVLLFFTFKLYEALVPFALIAGLAAAALFSGAALAKTQEPI